MTVFVAFLVLLGYGFDRFYMGGEQLVFPAGTLIALGVGSVSALGSYYSGDRAVLLSTKAVPIDRALSESSKDETLKLRQLNNVVDEMSIASGLPKPAVYLIPDIDPNAFATGRDPEHASVAVTRGLLDAVTRDELQGVIAHELSHVRNLDIRLMTVIAAMMGAIALLSDWTRRGLFRNSRSGAGHRERSKGKGGGGAIVLLAVWLVVALLAPIIGQMLAMMVSRRREYLADASAAELTRNPLALATALEKIDQAHAPTLAIKRGSAHLCIADPLGRAVGLRRGWVADLLASHPPMSDRIAALRQMGFQQ